MPPSGKTPRKPRKLSKHQLLIKAFLAETSECNWPNEMRIASILIKKYGFELLMSFEGATKLKSLVWFLGETGKKFLHRQIKLRKLKFRSKNYPLENKPLGKRAKINKKPVSIKDFLNIFNK
jgi:hypothetical protein